MSSLVTSWDDIDDEFALDWLEAIGGLWATT